MFLGVKSLARRGLIEEHLGESHVVYHLEIAPSDVGFTLIRRPRVYTVVYCKKKVRVLSDPVAVFKEVSTQIRCEVPQTRAACCLIGSPSEVVAYENILRSRRKKTAQQLQSASDDWTYLLNRNQRQSSRLQAILVCFWLKYVDFSQQF